MCYSLYLSTSSREDLTRWNSELLSFQRLSGDEPEAVSLLRHQEKWYVGSKSGCSCTFRHLLSVELGFGEPVDWYPEDDNDVRATAELYRVIRRLITQGYQVDCVDLWSGAQKSDITKIAVSLEAVPERAFRLFENHHFVFAGK
jgi:hypothetical protein